MHLINLNANHLAGTEDHSPRRNTHVFKKSPCSLKPSKIMCAAGTTLIQFTFYFPKNKLSKFHKAPHPILCLCFLYLSLKTSPFLILARVQKFILMMQPQHTNF